MKLSPFTLCLSFLVLAEAASIQQQLKRVRGESDGDVSTTSEKELPSNGRRGLGDGRSRPKLARRGVSLDVVDARLSTSSSQPLLGYGDAQPARAMAAAPSVTTTTVTAGALPSKQQQQQQQQSTVRESFSTLVESNEVDVDRSTDVPKRTTSTSTSTSSASTTTQTAPIVYNKINMTLAIMPYEQIMCEDTTQVQSGSVINITWLSRGKYLNSIYLRYGIDEFQTWNLPVGGSLLSYAGKKIDKGDETIEDPEATYRMTFQTQVFAWQKGIKLSIVILDQQSGNPIVTFESPQLSINSRCVVQDEKPLDDEQEEEDEVSNEPEQQEEEAYNGENELEDGQNAKKVNGARAGNLTSELTNPRVEGAMLGMVHKTSIIDIATVSSSAPTSSSTSRSSAPSSEIDIESGSRTRQVKGSSKHSFVIFLSVLSFLYI